jgi:hypothetical protein
MFNKLSSILSLLFLTVLAAVILHSCANIAAPTGGPRDIDPPVPLRATPDFYALNVDTRTRRIDITFDENVRLVRPMENVIITPPQTNMPVVRAIGRRVRVELNDELPPNTTVVVDFTNAIVDNNEGNVLEGFVYMFSTGDVLDTLSISGHVLSAYNLEPQQNIIVGLHTNLDDSAFTTIPFERISRTDSRGRFTIRGVQPGEFRIFALEDANRNFIYDQPQETVAFLETIIVPSVEMATREDTIFNFFDRTIIDTIFTVSYTRFLPDDLVLRTFVSDFQRKLLQRHERPEENILNITFSAPTELPTFSLLDPEISGSDWYVMERTARNDSIKLWITDSLIFRQDSLRMEINFLRTDTLDPHVLVTDTLHFNYRRRPPPEPAPLEQRRIRINDEEEEEGIYEYEYIEPPIDFLDIRTNVQASFELYNPVRIEFEQPILHFDSTMVTLALEVDTIFTPVPFLFEPDVFNPRKFVLRPRWQPGGTYKITIDSAAVHSHFGKWNNKLEQRFTVKDIDQYTNLTINILGLPEGVPAFVEVFNRSDSPIRRGDVINHVAGIQDLHPGEVFLRVIIDENGDGKWTTGNFEKGIQPEMVFYFPEAVTLRANSDVTVTWNVLEVPITEQKPFDILQNRPEERRLNPELEAERERRALQQQQRAAAGN